MSFVYLFVLVKKVVFAVIKSKRNMYNLQIFQNELLHTYNMC